MWLSLFQTMMFSLFKGYMPSTIVDKNTSREYNVTDTKQLRDEIEEQIEKNQDLIYKHKVNFVIYCKYKILQKIGLILKVACCIILA